MYRNKDFYFPIINIRKLLNPIFTYICISQLENKLKSSWDSGIFHIRTFLWNLEGSSIENFNYYQLENFICEFFYRTYRNFSSNAKYLVFAEIYSI